MTENWLCARIYYYDVDKDALLLNCLSPLYAELRTQGTDHIVLERHWRGGPHLALYIRDEGGQARRFEEIIRHGVETHLRVAPSTRSLMTDEAQRIHKALSQYEALNELFTPLKPNNSITFSDEPPPGNAYPSQEARMLANAVASDTLPLTLDMITAAAGNPDRKRAWIVWLLLTYAKLLGPVEFGYFFMRAYVEKVQALPPNDPDIVRARLSLIYTQRRETMRTLVTDFLAEERLDRPLLERRWSETLARALATAQAAIGRGDRLVWRNDEAVERYTEAGWDANLDIARTPFLRRWRADSTAWRKFDESSFYQAHMFCVNQIYRIVHLLGVSAQEKLIIFSLICATIEEMYDIDPLQRIAQS